MRLLILLIFTFTIYSVCAQEKPKVEIPDSMKTPPKTDAVRFDRFLLMQDLALFNPPASLKYNPVFGAFAGFSALPGDEYKMRSDFLSPLYNRYLEDSKISPFTYILGVAQGAAVGYMLYEHIRKYGGIWDKKK
jgi:hypothetical protein